MVPLWLGVDLFTTKWHHTRTKNNTASRLQKQRMLGHCLEMTDGPWQTLNETLRRLPSLEVWDTFGRGCQWL